MLDGGENIVAGVRPQGGACKGWRTTPMERRAHAGDSSLIAGRGRTHGDLGLGLAVFQDVRGEELDLFV